MKIGKASLRGCARITACMLLVIVLPAQVTQRPIGDFLKAQGASSNFFPPVPDYLGWAQALCTSGGLGCLSPEIDFGRFCGGDFVLVDYAGLADQYLVKNGFQSSGTVMDGTVTERRISPSSVEISVTLHTKNALTFVLPPTQLIAGTSPPCGTGWDFLNGPLLLGQRPTANPSLQDRALAESFFYVSFVNPAGAPLPDLLDLFFNRYPDLAEYSFNAVGSGPLRSAFGVPDGTPGTVTVVQAGKGSRSNSQPAVVNLRQTGH
jgi:hypothetical protein